MKEIVNLPPKDTMMNPVNGIPTVPNGIQEIENLPAPCEGKNYVVSSIVCFSLSEREGRVCPWSSDL